MKLATGLLTALLLLTILPIVGFNLLSQAAGIFHPAHPQTNNQIPATMREIPLPDGYTRVALRRGSFGGWLQNFKLSKNNTVHLYNGQPAQNQRWHCAVLDLSTGTKNLQQCADAIIRLRAEQRENMKRLNLWRVKKHTRLIIIPKIWKRLKGASCRNYIL